MQCSMRQHSVFLITSLRSRSSRACGCVTHATKEESLLACDCKLSSCVPGAKEGRPITTEGGAQPGTGFLRAVHVSAVQDDVQPHA